MSALREFVSRKGREAQFQMHGLLPLRRAMPHFIVIGAQKSGTSSMFVYLKQHPQILRPVFKELYYFDRHYERGMEWYGCNFPTQSRIDWLNDRYGRSHLTFEATATYIFDARVPERIATDLKTRKFVALLRDPTDRAISQYQHACRMGLETRSLEDALKADQERYEADVAFEGGRGPKPVTPPPRPTYLRRGIYAEAVAHWRRFFSPDELMVIQSETMFADPASVMKRVFTFLGLQPAPGIDYEPHNVGGYKEKDAEVRRWLKDFYRPHNETLSEISGTQFTW